MKPEVCVIVPTYGQFAYARRAVESLAAASEGVRTACVLVDDCSPEWPEIAWRQWGVLPDRRVRFRTRGGLTRSWNRGLAIARQIGARYAVCTNSDVLFTEGWFAPLAAAIESGFALAGPVTNAPGDAPHQDVRRYLREGVRLTDTERSIAAVLTALRARRRRPVAAMLNGFFLMARTAQWWRGAYSARAVFDPKFPLVGNEDELQRRWFARGWSAAFVPESYVFHYRSVSRPEGLLGRCGGGAYRRAED